MHDFLGNEGLTHNSMAGSELLSSPVSVVRGWRLMDDTMGTTLKTRSLSMRKKMSPALKLSS